jgi:mono/diheme cytochrome c family protein
VTEIPEHLLKRSQAARSKAGGDGDAAATPSAATPAKVEAAAPVAKAAAVPAVPAAPPPPEPDLPVVTAYKQRKKIPIWAMATLSLLPIWLFMYVRSVTPTEEVVEGPIGLGAEVYSSNCASCHGGAGEGGAGRVLNAGQFWATFPRIEDALNWIYFGTEGYEAAGVSGYGDPNREGGQHATRSYNGGAMPAQGGNLTDYEILAATCYIRYSINEVDTTGDLAAEYDKWCSEESPTFAELEAGALTLTGIPEVGDAPREPLEDQTPGAVAEG